MGHIDFTTYCVCTKTRDVRIENDRLVCDNCNKFYDSRLQQFLWSLEGCT